MSHPLGVRELKHTLDGQGNSSRRSHPLGVRELKPRICGRHHRIHESHPFVVRELKQIQEWLAQYHLSSRTL